MISTIGLNMIYNGPQNKFFRNYHQGHGEGQEFALLSVLYQRLDYEGHLVKTKRFNVILNDS